ncbi:MAG: PAS domain S-box protein [Bacteroidales bacterium]|nr:PAS domain S-box protein [Bacteroidales bacterium]
MKEEPTYQELEKEIEVLRIKLKESEEKHIEILNTFKYGIYIKTSGYKIVYANSALQEKVGYNPVGETCYKVLYNKNEVCSWCVNKKFSEEKRSIDYEIKNGNEKFLKVNNVLLENKNILTVFNDITDIKNNEQALKESDQRYKDAEKIAQLGHWVLDFKNNELFWSDHIFRMFGLKPNEFTPTYESFLENIHPDDRDMVNEAYSNSLKNKLPYEIELRILLKNGELKYVKEICRTEYDKAGKPIRSFGIVIDITRQKKIEHEAIIAKESVEESELKLKERVKELNGIYALGILSEKYENLDDIYTELVNNIIPKSLQFPDRVFVLLKIDKQTFCNIENYKLSKNKQNLSAGVNVFKKPIGKLIVAYTEKVPFIDIFEQKLIDAYAERISKIIERTRTQQELKIAVDKFRKLSSITFEGILIHEQGIVIDVNHSLATILGYKYNELIGKNIIKMAVPENYISIVQNNVAEAKTIPYEIEVRKKDGSIIPVEIESKNFNYENKKIRVTAVRDITDRKKADQALRESKDQLTISNKNLLDERNIFMIGNVVVLKWENKEGWPVEYVSQNAANVFGYTNEDFIDGKVCFADLIHEEDKERVGNEVKDAIDNNLNYFSHKEYRILNKSGEEVWLYDFTTILRNNKNEITHFYGYVMDVTERVKTEHEIIKAKEKAEETGKLLQELNATKDKFLSIIAHDLKSPFTSMLGFSDLLMNNFDKYDVPKQKDFVNIIHKGVKNTLKLLENLLLWSRTQRDSIEFNPESENLYLLSNESIDVLSQLAAEKSITLINDVPKDIFINADKNMLSTILRNLISNAIKYTHKGGRVIIKTCASTYKNNQKYCEVCVKDNGVGIEQKNLSKIFSISENISTKGTENEHGTGLGLILCKEFVEKHGGEIWVESEHGKAGGSEFKFTIPYV